MRRLALASVGTLLFAAGCTELPDLAGGYCGNHIVEPNLGEDCDSSTSSTCGRPGSDLACVALCPNGPADCEAGWTCGLDGVCRQPAGTYEVVSVSATPALGVDVVDVDADDIAEVFWISGAVELTLGSLTSDPPELRVLLREPVSGGVPVEPATSTFLREALVSPVFSDEGMLATLSTPWTEDRGPNRTTAQLLALERIDMQAGSLDGVLFTRVSTDAPIELVLGHEYPLGVDGRDILDLFTLLDGGPTDLRVGPVLPAPTTEMVGEPLLITTDAATRKRALVYAYPGDAFVYVQQLPDAFFGDLRDVLDMPPQKVQLQLGFPNGMGLPMASADINLDGHADLIAFTPAGLSKRIAYGVGDGTFHSQPNVPSSQGDGSFGAWAAANKHWSAGGLLLAANVTDDCFAVADLLQVHVGCKQQPLPPVGFERMPPASQVFADFDGDDDLDLVTRGRASDGNGKALELMRNNGDDWIPQVLHIDEEQEICGAADLDGDGADDVVLRNGEQLAVMWGTQTRWPAAPLEVFSRAGLRVAAVGRLASERGDGIITVERDEMGHHHYGFVHFNAARQPIAPLSRERDEARRVVLGDFDGASGADMAVLFPSFAFNPFDPEVFETLDVYLADDGVAPRHNIPLRGEFAPAPDGLGQLAELVAIDLDGAPGEELVVIGPMDPLGTEHRSQLMFARLEDGNVETSDAVEIPLRFAHTELLVRPPTAAGGYGAHPLPIDVDGDGDEDLLMLTDEPQPKLVLFLNRLTGALTSDDMIVFAPSEQLFIRDFAAISTAPNHPPHFVLATTNEPRIVELDLDAGSLVEIARVTAVTGTHVGAGDINGDGLIDIVLGDDGSATPSPGLELLIAKPTNLRTAIGWPQ